MLRLVKTGAEGDGPRTDVMEITKPDDLTDIARLGDRAREGGPKPSCCWRGSNGRSSLLRPEATSFVARIVDAAAVFAESRTTGSI
jgi:hypothetical protein